jgi:hypothetical protein
VDSDQQVVNKEVPRYGGCLGRRASADIEEEDQAVEERHALCAEREQLHNQVVFKGHRRVHHSTLGWRRSARPERRAATQSQRETGP